MKKLNVVLFLMLVVPFSISRAQNEPAAMGEDEAWRKKSPEERADIRTQKLTDLLTLSAEQQARVQSINLEKNRQVDELYTQLVALQKQRDNEISAVLTDEQRATYEARKTEVKDKMQTRREKLRERRRNRD